MESVLLISNLLAYTIIFSHFGFGFRLNFRLFRRLCFWRKPIVRLSGDLFSHQFVYESVRAGSKEISLPMPKNQCLFGYYEDGNFVVNGCAVRFGDWIVMPGHVFIGMPSHSKILRGRDKDVDITNYPYEDLDTDLVALKLGPNDMSVLGLRLANIVHEMSPAGHFVSIVGPFGKGTTGTLKEDVNVFGRVVYLSTTVAGYSGAAYMAGTSMVGVHQSGGAVNGGYSASYVWSLLSVIEKRRDEDSQDWLQQCYKRRQRIKIDPKWGSPDEIRIQVNGRYAIVQRDSMTRAFGRDWDVQFSGDYMEYRDFKDYRDHESALGECASSSSPGASSTSVMSRESELSELLKLIPELKMLLTDYKARTKKFTTTRAKNTSILMETPNSST